MSEPSAIPRLVIIGLGKMGGNMARRLRRADISVAAWNLEQDVTAALAAETGLTATASVEELVESLDAPRTVWLMLPAGDVTETYVKRFSELLEPGDLIYSWNGAPLHADDPVARFQTFVALARQGNKVVLRFRRGTKKKAASVKF